MRIVHRPLPYENALESRDPDGIELLVVHCTELPDLATARTYAERIHYTSGTGNSGHYYIDRDGACEQWVSPARVAHHVRDHNRRSIGVELVNLGRYPDWLSSAAQTMQEDYPAAQIDALIELIEWLTGQHPQLKHIAGHEDMDTEQVPASDDAHQRVSRKMDPGPLFPWPRVMQAIPLINIGKVANRYD